MQTVGSYLRTARESLGIQLEDAANTTRIGKNYLIALEEERFERLPSPAYVKGFLRVYAGFLGLSGDEVVAMYDNSIVTPQARQELCTDNGGPKPAPASGRKWRPGLLLPMLLVVISVPLLIYLFNNGEGEKSSDNSTQMNQEQRTTIPSVPILPPRSSNTAGRSAVAQADVVADVEGAVSSQPVAQEGIILKMKVNQDCWLSITIDGADSQQYNLKAGDLIEWKGNEVFKLDLGNAGGVEAELNGKPLKPFGGQGMTAHVVLRNPGA